MFGWVRQKGGLAEQSVLPEHIHAADHERLVKLMGQVTADTLRTVEDRVRIVDNPNL